MRKFYEWMIEKGYADGKSFDGKMRDLLYMKCGCCKNRVRFSKHMLIGYMIEYLSLNGLHVKNYEGDATGFYNELEKIIKEDE